VRLRRLLALSWKELLHVVRDPRSLAVALAIPVLMLLLFGWALSMDVRNVRLAVWDQSWTPQSRGLVSSLAHSRSFDVVFRTQGYQALEQLLLKRQVAAVLVLRDSGRGAAMQLLLDGTDAYTAAIASGYADAIVRLSSSGTASPVRMEGRIVFNEAMRSQNAIVPGLIAVILMVIAAMLTSLTIAREWENGTLEMLAASPLRPWEVILGKMLPYLAIGLVDLLISSLTGMLLFGVPFRGSPALLLFLSSVFMIGSLSLGIAISAATRNQLLASQLAMITTFLPAFLLSGLLFDLDNLPLVVRWISHLVPARYFVQILKGIYLKGLGLEFLYSEVLFLVAFALLVLLLTRARFRLSFGARRR
jgi:ABC-2 type transport system permease protein